MHGRMISFFELFRSRSIFCIVAHKSKDAKDRNEKIHRVFYEMQFGAQSITHKRDVINIQD